MKKTTITFTEEEQRKAMAENLCAKIGIDLQTYLQLCIGRLIQEQGIPFSLKSNLKEEKEKNFLIS